MKKKKETIIIHIEGLLVLYIADVMLMKCEVLCDLAPIQPRETVNINDDDENNSGHIVEMVMI